MTPATQEARRWIGTPYLHQGAVRGAGCDCLGLVRGVWRALQGSEPVVPPPYTSDWGEIGGSEVLWEAARRHLAKADAEPWADGQILLFRMRKGAVAKHLGILATAASGSLTFIHAYSGHGVIESPLSTPWRRRVVARFTFNKG